MGGEGGIRSRRTRFHQQLTPGFNPQITRNAQNLSIRYKPGTLATTPSVQAWLDAGPAPLAFASTTEASLQQPRRASRGVAVMPRWPRTITLSG